MMYPIESMQPFRFHPDSKQPDGGKHYNINVLKNMLTTPSSKSTSMSYVHQPQLAVPPLSWVQPAAIFDTLHLRRCTLRGTSKAVLWQASRPMRTCDGIKLAPRYGASPSIVRLHSLLFKAGVVSLV